LGKPYEKRHFGDVGVDGDNIEIDLQKMVWEVLNSIVRLRTGTGFRT